MHKAETFTLWSLFLNLCVGLVLTLAGMGEEGMSVSIEIPLYFISFFYQLSYTIFGLIV
jgi:hypothetical protein